MLAVVVMFNSSPKLIIGLSLISSAISSDQKRARRKALYPNFPSPSY